ncbi:MAG: ComEA family DNA-binding protein [Planctomycetota bacterium]
MNRPPQAIPGTNLVAIALALALALAAVAGLRQVTPSDPAADVPPAPWPEMRVDLNAADAAELTLLPGIGPRLAARIVADRAERGRFETVDDLERVHRIGPATVRRLRRQAIVEAGH